MEKYKKSHIEAINLRCELQHGMENLNYLIDDIIYISDIQYYFEYIFKKHGGKTANLLIRIYMNKIENRITLKIKAWYCLYLLTPETMQLLGSTKSEITRDEKVDMCLIAEVVLKHCNVVSNNYQQNSRVLYVFVPNKSSDQLLNVSLKKFMFLKTFDSNFHRFKCSLQNSNLLEIK